MPHSINITFVIIVFISVLVLSNLLLRNLTKVEWKYLDMAALVLAFFGLFPATYDSQKWFDDGERASAKEVADKNALFTIQYFDMRVRETCSSETPVQRNVQGSVCMWLTGQRENFRGNAERLLPVQIEPLQNGLSGDQSLANDLVKVGQWYNVSTKEWLQLNNKPKEFTFTEGMNNLVKSFSAIFGPYSLAIALALKLTQIRAEIADEQNKRKLSQAIASEERYLWSGN